MPCSPPPPTVFGLQLLSCIAKEASKMGGTVYSAVSDMALKMVEPGRTTELAAIFVEQADHFVRAGLERLIAYIVEVRDGEIVDLDVRGIPSAAVDATIEIILGAVGAARSRYSWRNLVRCQDREYGKRTTRIFVVARSTGRTVRTPRSFRVARCLGRALRLSRRACRLVRRNCCCLVRRTRGSRGYLSFLVNSQG